MAIKNRLKKLEAKVAPSNFVLPPKFIVFGDAETERAIVPGFSGELRRQSYEDLGEFCKRVYRTYVDAQKLAERPMEDLSGEELQYIAAAGSEELAQKLYRYGALSAFDNQSALGR